MAPVFKPSVCPHDCPSTCALEVEKLDDGTVGKIRGAKGNDYTKGVVCAKVAAYRERVHHPERLTTPLKRIGDKGEGTFQPLSWDDALDEIATAFVKATERYGAETVWPYFFAGTMGLVQRDGIDRLRHAMNYSRMKQTICVSTAYAGWLAGVGDMRGVDPREIAHSDVIVIWGGNPVSTQVNVMTHIRQAQKNRDAKVITIDPYRTPTAATSDMHLMLKPGTDGALAVAVMHVLFKENLADRDYLLGYSDNAAGFERHLENKTPEWAAAITGLTVREIIDFATIYGAAKRSFIRVGYGFSRSRNGAANVHAVSALPTVTGAWACKGGGALYTNSGLYKIDQTLIRGLDCLDESVRELDMSRIGDILLGDDKDLSGGPPVTAMIIQNQNPAVVAPEQNKVLQGLARDDLFLAVHEQFMTPTARFADIVLPATTFLEHDDIYKGGGHIYLQIAKKIIDPVGESRSNHDVICALAKRLGADHPGFDMTAWEMIDRTLKDSGLPDGETIYENGGHDCSVSFEDAHFLNGFAHPDGKFRFSPDWKSIGDDCRMMPEFPDHMNNIENSDDQHPFRLITPPARRFLNSTFTEMPSSRKKEGAPKVLVHPEVMGEMNISDGDLLRLGNARGEVVLPARCFDGVQKDVIVVEGIWPNDYFQGGKGINVLIGADAAPPNGGAVFHDASVWLKMEPK